MTVLIFAVFVPLARLSLALPAKALARNDASFGAAWRMTTGNTLRLLFGYLLCVLPWTVLFSAVARFMFRPGLSREMIVADLTVTALGWIIFGMVSIGFLSMSYRHLSPEAPPA